MQVSKFYNFRSIVDSQQTSELDFVVIDTEGKTQLKEIAIINSQGQLIYEAFTAEHPDNYHRVIKQQPLKNILLEFGQLTQNKIIVFHYAAHDIKVLKNSFKQANLLWQYLSNVRCTYTLAKECYPNFYAHSLEYLAQKLSLKVDHQYFNPQQAHTARYDAQFTHQLYLAINKKMALAKPAKINPFSSSRVDNPFQNHPDNTNVYHSQYAILESIIDDIKYDRNHQSQGAVVIGEPGTGKTHLMMRLAHNRLQYNRLLFIPCPNDANTVKYHIYSCILESLNKKIPGTNYNQLEDLLAYSFVKIISTKKKSSQKIISLIEKTKNNPLTLYEILGREGTQIKRNNWDIIEKETINWWSNQYGISGYSPEIIKGIVRFCRYSEPNYKELIKRWLAADELEPEELNKIGLSLNNWHEAISKENFSLEAIAILGRLSLLNEPLIIVFDQLEMLGLEHNQNILFSFGEAVKEIFTRVPYSLIILNLFPNRWQHFQQTFDGSIIARISQQQINLKKPTEVEIKDILELKAQAVDTTLETLFTKTELQQILSKKGSIRAVLNNAADYYRYKFNNVAIPERASECIDTSISNISQPEIKARLTKIEAQYTKLEALFNNIAEAFAIFSQTKNELEVIVDTTENKNKNIDNALEKSLVLKIKNYIQDQYQVLAKKYSLAEIIIDEKDTGKLKDIIQVLSHFAKLETDILPSKRKLPPHLVITNKNLCIGFLSSPKGNSFTSRLQNYNEFVAKNEKIKFQLWRDVRSNTIKKDTVGAQEIAKLNNTKNGTFLTMDRETRINFELIYQLISDIYNQDLDINLKTELKPALRIIVNCFKDYWLIKALL